MQIAATVLIKSPLGYLFLKRYDNDRTVSGYCLPGGKLDGSLYASGIEYPHEAVLRELFEETGIDISEDFLTFKGVYFAEPKKDKQFLINVFYAELELIPRIIINLDELESFKWVENPYSNFLKLAGTTKYALDLCKIK